ncbi:MAG TPA: HAMP domain-containing sensor histidine kinase [Kofleriaceae bacterium]|jgi:signal transduction histidine kinase|nr:HAMP domain-containing sensor histidine kinase [Kofleriaceae bacterium]
MSEAQARARSTVVDHDRIEEELRRVVAARDEMLAIVSHDLRNPLSAVQLSARLLGELGLDERARKHLEMIQRAIRSMSRLIEDLLDAVSIDSGKLALDLRPVPVADVMREVRERNQTITRDRSVELRVTCEAAPAVRDVAILADRARVLQLFANLIGNAVTFCRTGGAVSIACQNAGDAVEFSVTDTGPGIDPGLLPHLFEPYWSAPPAIRRRIGLGLYIVKGIVERHGGRIRVERGDMGGGVGAGPAIVFTLPRSPKAP